MKKIIYSFAIPTILLWGISLSDSNKTPTDTLVVNQNTPVWTVLQYFGEPLPNHLPDTTIDGYRVEAGEQIVLRGCGKPPGGKKVRLQSKHFVCTSCHNIVKEDPNLANPDPQARLDYAAQHNLPFLQGTTLYGAVNRNSFYNDDYEKKYGDLVAPTRHNLREAIQLCAVECSQGRRLKDWELESVLGYLWTLQLKMGDLQLVDADYRNIQQAANDGSQNKMIADKIKRYFFDASPAHFADPPADRKNGDGLKGNPANGKKVYEQSCLHCHANERYSFFELNNNKLTFRYLKAHFTTYSYASTYQVARYGTSPLPGKRAYMPQYPLERLSKQQMADLRAYVEEGAR